MVRNTSYIYTVKVYDAGDNLISSYNLTGTSELAAALVAEYEKYPVNAYRVVLDTLLPTRKPLGS